MDGTVEIKGSDGLLEQGNELVISCTAPGGHNNTLKWTHNRADIQQTVILNITTVITDTFINSTLRISSVDASEHKGNYTCVVSNIAGQESSSLLVVGMYTYLLIMWSSLVDN